MTSCEVLYRWVFLDYIRSSKIWQFGPWVKRVKTIAGPLIYTIMIFFMWYASQCICSYCKISCVCVCVNVSEDLSVRSLDQVCRLLALCSFVSSRYALMRLRWWNVLQQRYCTFSPLILLCHEIVYFQSMWNDDLVL